MRPTADRFVEEPPATSLGPLGLRDFRWFLASLAAATLGTQVQAAAIAYQLYTITHDPLALGLIGLAEALPFIAVALPAGHLADMRNRRRLCLGALSTLVFLALVLLFLPRLAATGGARVAQAVAYAVIGATGVCRGFLQPARAALSAEIVPRTMFVRAIPWRTGVFQATAVAGPALGGALYAAFGAGVAYATAAGLLAIGAVAMQRIGGTTLPAAAHPARFFAALCEGVRFLREDRVLLPAIALDLFAVLLGGAVALLPAFAEDILHVGATGFGVLRAAPAAGAVAMSIVLLTGRKIRHAGRTLLISVALFGVFTIGFGLSRSFVLSVVLLTASGAADMVSVVIRGTLMQVRVPLGMLGRLSAINQIFIGSSNEIGAFESGVAARLLGTVPAVVVGGGATIAIVLVTAWRAPALRRLEELR